MPVACREGLDGGHWTSTRDDAQAAYWHGRWQACLVQRASSQNDDADLDVVTLVAELGVEGDEPIKL